MTKMLRRGLPFSAEVAPLIDRMAVVDEYRENLLRLQGAWDSLAMLGQMSGTVPDLADTRSAFAQLTGTLLDNLALRQLGNVQHRLRSRAQVAIDVLVRNLFERTADVGFLATDTALCAHAERHHAAGHAPEAERTALEARFRAYVAKYSVYDDVVVLSPQGEVLARLDRRIEAARCSEPWLARAVQSGGYVEQHGPSALLGGRCGLIYANAVRSQGRLVGVLALSFRLDDEMRGIFAQLLPADDAGALVLVDRENAVVASSDPWQFPHGAPVRHGGGPRLRFAGREYLFVATEPTGYEGYHGPGWRALALLPSDAAFDGDDGPAGNDAVLAALVAGLDTRQLFDAELLAIGPQARRIERDLARVLWNGRLRRSGDASSTFAATLLREVGNTGERIRSVFDEATGKLYRSTLSAVFEQASDHARLAIDIVERNLYERANDCRWWALDGVLRATLAGGPEPGDAAAGAVLRHINGLYTVYSLLVLFDTDGRVIAVSDPAAAAQWQGRQLDEPWVAATLRLAEADGDSHAVSRHVPSALYADRPTFVFGAPLREGGRTIGGIGIVFDGAPQFAAMLADALPAGGNSAGLLVSRAGTVLASTDERFAVGSAAPLPPGWAALGAGAAASAVLDIEGTAYAAGFAMAGGYREYPVAAAAADDRLGTLLLTRLGERLPAAQPVLPPFEAVPQRSATSAAPLQIAGFAVDGQWLGLAAAQVVEALEAPRVAALPNAPRHLVGMLPFEGRMLPLVDLGLLRNAALPTPAEAPVIVVQPRPGQRLGLRVATLGPVFEANADTVHTLHCARGERMVHGLGGMLALLDAQMLWEAVCGGEPAWA